MSLHYLGKHEPGNCVFSVRHRHVSSPGECGWLRACGKARGRHFEHLQLTGSVQRRPSFWSVPTSITRGHGPEKMVGKATNYNALQRDLSPYWTRFPGPHEWHEFWHGAPMFWKHIVKHWVSDYWCLSVNDTTRMRLFMRRSKLVVCCSQETDKTESYEELFLKKLLSAKKRQEKVQNFLNQVAEYKWSKT